MTNEIKNFRLKLKNTERLKRPSLTFTVKEAKALDTDIDTLERRIKQLENEALQRETLTIDIVGSEF
jgi:predicted  nucleic acid-binding Zn-ribbon protein